MSLLQIRVRVATAEGDVAQAERDAREALAIAAEAEAYLGIPEVIECLAALTTDAGRHRDAARLFGSAAGIRDRTGSVRFKIYDADYLLAIAALREALAQQDFDSQWADGAARSTAEAVTNARRGSSEGNRPASGSTSLTPAELNVVRLVAEGLRNKDVAAKLFISDRTGHSHLTHIDTKLDLPSRLQLAQEAARHS